MTDSNDIHTPDGTANVPSDLDRLRRQAKQRFIGATVLVLIAVVAFPFLLDSQPRPIASNIVIDIPKIEVTPIASAPAVVVPLAFSASEPVVLASAPVVPAVAAASVPTVLASVSQPSNTSTDSARAQALLNGQILPAHGYAVQAGSYSEANKLHDVQTKLDKAGLKHYTQMAHGKDGTAYTRVRLGPFETQKEANATAAKLTKLGIKSMVVKPS